MAQQVSTLAYLQYGPPAIPISPPRAPSGNTSNDAYSYRDINAVTQWQGFNLGAILQQFGQMLLATRITDDQMPTSPAEGITTEFALHMRVTKYLTSRTQRALRQTFAHNGQNLQGFTAVKFDAGTNAVTIDRFIPDLAFYDQALALGTAANRVPGDVKPSWKWSSAAGQAANAAARLQYRQALSQVNFYMKQHRSRYGFLLTDLELVPIKRLDEDGNLEVATAIPWTTQGTEANPSLTVALGLWYLGMLAAQDNGPNRWIL